MSSTEQPVPQGILGIIESDGEAVGVAFDPNEDPTDLDAVNAYLADNGLPPLSEQELPHDDS